MPRTRPQATGSIVRKLSTKSCIFLFVVLLVSKVAVADLLVDQLEKAGDNAKELRRALVEIPVDQRAGLEFLITNMPERDLRSLTSEYLVENVELAYLAWRNSPWKDQISEELFFDAVLPYASINERRDRWRAKFHEAFSPLVKDAKSSREAAAILNNEVFKQLAVKYSRKRAKADQSPLESIDSGLASCTGLSVLLIDACRSVGVPARFVGTPLWSDRSGNHSWVEVWDGGWHFTGAAEPTGMLLDKGWFTARASRAKRDEPVHAIYATSFKQTPLKFPCVWDRQVDYVCAVNVTDRYTRDEQPLPAGHGYARFRVINADGDRVRCKLQVVDAKGVTCFSGSTRDEQFDSNDHLSVPLVKRIPFTVITTSAGQQVRQSVKLEKAEQLFTISLATKDLESKIQAENPISQLESFLAQSRDKRGDIRTQPFASTQLTRQQAADAKQLLWSDYVTHIKATRGEEMKAGILVDGELKMPFAYTVFGDKPANGRSLYISMHGGGGAPAKVNDRQWKNQQKLYQPSEGIYLAPRAPTNTWDLWHQPHIDQFFDRLIENLVVFEDVDPNRVYLMGYSAGGDGAYQLAPRMADRWAAVSMMAGHPNGTSPLSLRNIGFAIYMGGLDAAYKRNKIAAEWKVKLAKLKQDDPQGYHHQVTIYPDKGHWMGGEDASSIDWMSKQARNPFPDKVVWKQDNVTHPRLYWLSNDKPERGQLVVATLRKQTIDIETVDINSLSLLLTDEMLDLDMPVRITSGKQVLFEGLVNRSIATLHKSLVERGDRVLTFSAEVRVPIAEVVQ